MNVVIKRAIEIVGTQSELARRVGADQSTVSKWLNGTPVSSRFISLLSEATEGQITASEILESICTAKSDVK
ncbi:transcriptional regulator [Klebsiella oxytoca]|nr:helix-turn-helix domain-containing protein [Klebsiella oxytoca]